MTYSQGSAYPQGVGVQSDHDLLVIVAQGQASLRDDMRELADGMKDVKKSLDTISNRQTDLEQRMTNVSGTVQRVVADQNDDERNLQNVKAAHEKGLQDMNGRILAIEADLVRWKTYMRVGAVLSTPVYLIIIGLAAKAAQVYFLGP